MTDRLLSAAPSLLFIILLTPAYAEDTPTQKCSVTIEKFDTLKCGDKECIITGYDEHGENPRSVTLGKDKMGPDKTTKVWCAHSVGQGLYQLEGSPPIYVLKSETKKRMVPTKPIICHERGIFLPTSPGSNPKC